jgi:hypothetical protein
MLSKMKKYLLFTFFCFLVFPLFAQAGIAQLAPGAENQLSTLLNKPALVKPAEALPLGKNWFNMELDAHVFTDQASFKQVVSVLGDLENHDKIFDGKRNKKKASIISRTADGTIADIVSITPAPLGIQIKTSYRVIVRTLEDTPTKFLCEMRQTPEDSNSNKDIKNLVTFRYAQELVINGKTYTYIRIYSIDDVNGSVLPNAKKTFENNSGPANEETLLLIIEAAKAR